MNPPGFFKDGKRQQEYSVRNMLPASGRLLPEFDLDKRRSIKDMFARKPPSTPSPSSSMVSNLKKPAGASMYETDAQESNPNSSRAASSPSTPLESQGCKELPRKRSQPTPVLSAKRSKSVVPGNPSTAGQKTLKGFFKPKNLDGGSDFQAQQKPVPSSPKLSLYEVNHLSQSSPLMDISTDDIGGLPTQSLPSQSKTNQPKDPNEPNKCIMPSDTAIDPIVNKEDWTKLFTKKPIPRCESHQEPCISLTTKKPGINCGRAFWICPRPLGPSGEKQKGTQWRCPTFIWASDWNGPVPSEF